MLYWAVPMTVMIEGLSWDNAGAAVEKHMSAAPRRIVELILVIDMPREVRTEHWARLEEIARTCPMARSIHPDVKVQIDFALPGLTLAGISGPRQRRRYR